MSTNLRLSKTIRLFHFHPEGKKKPLPVGATVWI